ncbi:Septum formation initiator [Alkaliphilus metalliredigens QYMF]|uniref:Septum formation initiator n=1 Tax=Alkaliphilus metalliredigens (strain QYMF) TaxID=293826 RepID=A6TJP0_ALKMQ|nr:septum formation initiator family protein [Alkaliphilus metalliredigens]ABR46408.1 Septum formation initiator [Alkaliphilus metalliredigens QYMF]
MKRKKKRFNKMKIYMLGIVVLVGGSVTTTLYDQQKEMRYLDQREAALHEEIERLSGDVQHLRTRLEDSGTDEYINGIAREQLKMVGEDEIIFIDLNRSKN